MVCLSAAIGCSAGLPEPDDDQEVVTVWHAYRGAERAGLEQLLQQLDAARSDLQIELLAVPSQAYKSRLLAAIPRGNGPDLFIEAHEISGEWARAGLIDPLPESLGPDEYEDVVREAMQFEGRQWGVPIAVKSLALFRNTDLAPESPERFEDLMAAGEVKGASGASSSSGDTSRRAVVWETGEFYYQAPFVHAFGGRVLSSDGEVLLDSRAVQRSLDFVGELASAGRLSPEADGALVSTLFNQAAVPYVISGPWFVGEVAPSIPFEVSLLPTLVTAGRPLQPFVTVEALFRSKERTASEGSIAAVIRSVAGLDGSIHRAVHGRQTPAHLQAQRHSSVVSDPVLRVFAEQASVGVPMPNRAEMGVVWEPANRALRAVLRGSMTARAALARAQKEAESFLRPPPQPAPKEPFLLLLALLCLGAAFWAWKQSRRGVGLSQVWSSRSAYLWLAPAFLGMTVVVLLPFVVGASVALFAHHDGSFTFVGLRNFVRILASTDQPIGDPLSFWFTLVVTVGWTASNVALHVGIGVGLALLLREPWLRLRGLYRVLLIVPWAVPNYITALIWRGMFNEQFGAINALLVSIGLEPLAWFSRFATSFAANLCTNTWLGFPFMMVVTLGALQAVPRDLEEAAAVDGAGPWRRFVHVTLPLLKPALLPAVLLGSVWTFNMFNIIYLVSSGEPDGSTEILISEAYKWAFTRQAQYGYAAAYAVLVFGVLLLYAALTRRLTGGRVS